MSRATERRGRCRARAPAIELTSSERPPSVPFPHRASRPRAQVWYTYQELSKVEGGEFTVAAAFGNVHGVYAPGNVRLTPQILHDTQSYIKEKLGCDTDKPVKFVFHGGSGSSTEDIRYAIKAGTIKMNIDTDTQWAFWDGIRSYEAKNRDYLQGQIGNPEGETKPNKKYYDPRMALRSGEESMAAR